MITKNNKKLFVICMVNNLGLIKEFINLVFKVIFFIFFWKDKGLNST